MNSIIADLPFPISWAYQRVLDRKALDQYDTPPLAFELFNLSGLLLRWYSALLLAAYIQAGSNNIVFNSELLKLLQTSSDGAWYTLIEKLLKALKSNHLTLLSPWIDYLANPANSVTPTGCKQLHQWVALRNQWAHGLLEPEHLVEAWFEMEKHLNVVASLNAAYQWFAQSQNQTWLLQGLISLPQLNPPIELDDDQVCLYHPSSQQSLSLHPLFYFVPPSSNAGHDLLLINRLSQYQHDYLTYRHLREQDSKSLQTYADVRNWFAKLPVHTLPSEPIINYAELTDFHTYYFVGRQTLLSEIQNFICESDTPNFAILTAQTGQGKTALIAQLYRTHHKEWAFHFCAAEGNRDYPMVALRSLMAQLCKQHELNPQLYLAAHDLTQLQSNLDRLLAHIATLTTQKIVWVIDALDEGVPTAGPSVLTLLQRDWPKQFKFIITCRVNEHNQHPLLEQLNQSQIYYLNQGEPLSGLSKSEVNQIFEQLPGSTNRTLQLFEKIWKVTANGTEFADPLFLRFLISSIEDGQLKEESQIPNTLSGIFEKIWKDLPIQNNFLTHHILGVLSILRDKVDDYFFTLIWPEWSLQDILEARLALRKLLVLSSENDYYLFHQQVREFLQGKFRSKELLFFHQMLCENILVWHQVNHLSFKNYLLKHGSHHLAEANHLAGLWQLSQDSNFHQAQIELTQHYSATQTLFQHALQAYQTLNTLDSIPRLCGILWKSSHLFADPENLFQLAFKLSEQGRISESLERLNFLKEHQKLLTGISMIWQHISTASSGQTIQEVLLWLKQTIQPLGKTCRWSDYLHPRLMAYWTLDILAIVPDVDISFIVLNANNVSSYLEELNELIQLRLIADTTFRNNLIRLVEDVKQERRSNISCLVEIAVLQAKLGHKEMALNTLAEADNHIGDVVEPVNIIEGFCKAHYMDEAIGYLNEWPEDHPNYDWMIFTIIEYLIKYNQSKQAELLSRSLPQSAYSIIKNSIIYGEALLKQNQLEEAKTYCKSALNAIKSHDYYYFAQLIPSLIQLDLISELKRKLRSFDREEQAKANLNIHLCYVKQKELKWVKPSNSLIEKLVKENKYVDGSIELCLELASFAHTQDGSSYILKAIQFLSLFSYQDSPTYFKYLAQITEAIFSLQLEDKLVKIMVRSLSLDHSSEVWLSSIGCYQACKQQQFPKAKALLQAAIINESNSDMTVKQVSPDFLFSFLKEFLPKKTLKAKDGLYLNITHQLGSYSNQHKQKFALLQYQSQFYPDTITTLQQISDSDILFDSISNLLSIPVKNTSFNNLYLLLFKNKHAFQADSLKVQKTLVEALLSVDQFEEANKIIKSTPKNVKDFFLYDIAIYQARSGHFKEAENLARKLSFATPFIYTEIIISKFKQELDYSQELGLLKSNEPQQYLLCLSELAKTAYQKGLFTQSNQWAQVVIDNFDLYAEQWSISGILFNLLECGHEDYLFNNFQKLISEKTSRDIVLKGQQLILELFLKAQAYISHQYFQSQKLLTANQIFDQLIDRVEQFCSDMSQYHVAETLYQYYATTEFLPQNITKITSIFPERAVIGIFSSYISQVKHQPNLITLSQMIFRHKQMSETAKQEIILTILDKLYDFSNSESDIRSILGFYPFNKNICLKSIELLIISLSQRTDSLSSISQTIQQSYLKYYDPYLTKDLSLYMQEA